MHIDRFGFHIVAFLSSAVPFLGGCERELTVSYAEDVRPILEANCLECHTAGGAGAEKSGFKMDSYAELMEGTRYGPMIEPGESGASNLYLLVAGRADPSIQMPHGQEKLARADIETIRIWIDQGALDN
jgi:hypothetical protein